MSDDFFAGWTDLGDDADDPFNATSAVAPQQFVQPPSATQAEPTPSPALQQVTAAPQAQFYPAPQHPSVPLTAPTAMPTAPVPQQSPELPLRYCPWRICSIPTYRCRRCPT